MAARVERYPHTDADGAMWVTELDITMSAYASWTCGCKRPRGLDGGGYGKYAGDARWDARHHHLYGLSNDDLAGRMHVAEGIGDTVQVKLCRDEIESRTRRGVW